MRTTNATLTTATTGLLGLTATLGLLGLTAVLGLASCGGQGQPEQGGPTSDPQEQEEERPMPPNIADPSFLRTYAETFHFRLGHPRSVRVLPDRSGVLYLRTPARSFVSDLYLLDLASGEERVLLTAEQILAGEDEELSEEERARRERMRQATRGIASYSLSSDGSHILVPLSGRLFVIDRAHLGEEGAIRELRSEAGFPIDPRFSPDGSKVICVRDGDLYAIDVASGQERRLTTRPGEEIENGVAEFVAQEEMGRYQGYWLSPDGQRLVYQQNDTTGMERMHLFDPAHPERPARPTPYPRPGHDNVVVRLGVMPVAGGPTRWIEWDRERYPYLNTVRWSEGTPLTLVVQDRAQQEQAILTADPATGATTTLHTERDEAWLNIHQEVPHWIEGGQSFLWMSERDGHLVLERRGQDGSLERALTAPTLGLRSLIKVDEERHVAWVQASEEPTEAHVFRVPLSPEGEGPGEAEQLTEGRGEHSALVSEDGALWVHTASTLEGEQVSTAKATPGTEGAENFEARALPATAEEIPFEIAMSLETVGRREWRTVVVRPRNFEEGRRYPVLVHVYAGPHVRYVSTNRRRYALNQWFADHGFIVVTIDGRGTPGRGREWERAIRGDLITAPLEDQVEALEQLADRHPEMDMERVGIFGWSFGGYFSAMAALQRPEVYRAAIVGAPVSEWRDYDTHYTERYLGLPEEEGEEGAYHRSSVLTYAAEAEADRQRPILLIHGTADDNVYFSHAIKLGDALFRAGWEYQMLPLSGFTHMVPDPLVAERLHTRMAGFFQDALMGERRPFTPPENGADDEENSEE